MRAFLPPDSPAAWWRLPARASHARGRLRCAAGITLAALSWLSLSGCSPELDWRSFQPEGLAVQVAFPCRPDRAVRAVPLAGLRMDMTLLSCEVAGRQYALLSAQVEDVGQVPGVLQALALAAQANLQARRVSDLPAGVVGITPLPQARRQGLVGRGLQGQPMQQQLVVFSHGPKVFQATVMGADLPEAAVQPFWEALQIRAVTP